MTLIIESIDSKAQYEVLGEAIKVQIQQVLERDQCIMGTKLEPDYAIQKNIVQDVAVGFVL